MGQHRAWTEEYTVDGSAVVSNLRDIIRDGKARRIIIKNAQGKTLLKVPLWLGAAAIFNNPRLLLFGAWKTTKEPLTFIVEKVEPDPEPPSDLS